MFGMELHAGMNACGSGNMAEKSMLGMYWSP